METPFTFPLQVELDVLSAAHYSVEGLPSSVSSVMKCDGDVMEKSCNIYDLKALCLHVSPQNSPGSSGHYVTLVRMNVSDTSSTWRQFDDDKVSVVPMDEVMASIENTYKCTHQSGTCARMSPGNVKDSSTGTSAAVSDGGWQWWYTHLFGSPSRPLRASNGLDLGAAPCSSHSTVISPVSSSVYMIQYQKRGKHPADGF